MANSAVDEKQQDVSFEVFIGTDHASFTRHELLPFPFFESYMTNWQRNSSTPIELGLERELSFGIADLKRLVAFAQKFRYDVLRGLRTKDFERFAACARYLCFQIPEEKRHQAAVAFAIASASPVVTKLLHSSTSVPSSIEPPPNELQEKMLGSYLQYGKKSWIIDEMSPEFKSSRADAHLSTLLSRVSKSTRRSYMRGSVEELQLILVESFEEQYQRCIECIGENNVPLTAEKLSQLHVGGTFTCKVQYSRNGRSTTSTASTSNVRRDLRNRVFRTIFDMYEVSSEIRRGFLTSQLWEIVLGIPWKYSSPIIPAFEDDNVEVFADILSKLTEEEFEPLAKVARKFIVDYEDVPKHRRKIWRILGNMVWAGVQVL